MAVYFWPAVVTQLWIFGLEHSVEKGVSHVRYVFVNVLMLFGRLVSEMLPTGVLLLVVVMVELLLTK